jgi:predicted dienelactone hydrolase
MRHVTVRSALPVVLVFAAACASKPPPAPAPAPAPTPPAAAELAKSGLDVALNADVVLRDSSRNREISVRVTYPQGVRPFPVIVFAPSAGASARSYDFLARFWATRGFAVLVPEHADGSGAKDPAAEAARETAADASADPKAWETSVRDVAFVAAATGAIEARISGLKLDDTRIGVGGQSFGAFTAMLLAGATVDVPRKEKAKSFADPLPKAFLLLSPPGKGQQGLTEKAWTAIERPLMVVTGTRDSGVKNQDASWRLDAYQLSPPGDKYAVFIEGAGHASLTGLSAEPGAPPKAGKKTTTPDEEVKIFQDVKAATLAFWEAYLKGDASARAFLAGDGLARESDNRAQVLRR